MGTHQAHLAPVSVSGVLNYLLDTGERPVNYTYPQPDGTSKRSGVLDPTQVSIHNARLLEEPANIDRQGFERLEHASAVANLEDDDQVRTHYYPETEALLKQRTGAVKVVIFDHTIRVDEPGREDRGLREPVRYVHNDQTERSAIRRVRDHLPADEAEQRLLKRFAIINVWRPIGAPVLSSPLAVCDARSIASGDLLPSDLVYRDKVGETFSVRANPAHRWYFYPRLQPDEVLLLKIHDSRRDVAQRSAHTAFDDPTTPADAPPRRSIELRALVFFAE